MPVITTFEEHGEVLAYFNQQGYCDETILYFDQHFDFKYLENSAVDKAKKFLIEGKDLSLLNRDIPFRDDDVFSYGLDNFLFMAEKLGYIKKLIWILPEPKNLDIYEIALNIFNIFSLIPYCSQKILNTLFIDKNSIHLTIGTLNLEVTTLRRLKSIDIKKISRLDIDLDYFYNSYGNCLTSIDVFLETLKDLDLLQYIHTITYSISSGFLPEKYRWLAEKIAQSIPAFLEHGSRITHKADKSIAALATGRILTLKELEKTFQSELYKLKGPGLALKSLLALQIPDLYLAIKSYEEALDQGDKASMAAYKIGFYLYQEKKYHEANEWFEKAQVKLTDSMNLHSLTMSALSSIKLNNFETALNFSSQAVDLVPLRTQNYSIALLSCQKLGLKDQENIFREKLENIAKFYNKFEGN